MSCRPRSPSVLSLCKKRRSSNNNAEAANYCVNVRSANGLIARTQQKKYYEEAIIALLKGLVNARKATCSKEYKHKKISLSLDVRGLTLLSPFLEF